ncbi:MAG: hypothetical protein CMN30_27690 [Sandaracinus sp.]|nr:hypothetical protein [Sandaracinus sp.]
MVTVRHHTGEKLEVAGRVARYRFLPEHVEAPEVSGEFTVDLDTWEFAVVVSTRLGHRADERCVSALVHKLRQAAPEVPARLYFIA